MNNIHNSNNVPLPDLFTGITLKNRTNILSCGRQNSYERGKILFRQGEPALRYYYVLEGHLKLTKLHEQGKEIIIHYVNSGELVAIIASLKEKNYPVTAKAISIVRVVSWDRGTMLKYMMQYPSLSINMLETTIDRMDKLQIRYLEFQAEHVKQRIARALLRIMKQSSRKTSEGILIIYRLSRQELANYTGTTLYTVSRTLSIWEKNGWIKSRREQITITDPHALISFAEIG